MNTTSESIIRPGAVWCDTDGKPIQAHGGGVLFHQGVYYWYGENKDVPNMPGSERVEVVGVSCYSSRDLLNWKHEGVVLPAVKDDPESDLHPLKVVERPKVIHNVRTGKFVMWLHIDDSIYQYARAGVAVADRPQGPFTYLSSVRPCDADSRDLTVFQDDDGAAYLVTGVLWHSAIQIVRLSDDYLRADGAFVRVLQRPGPPTGRESPAVFKRRGRYYLLSSGTTGWKPNAAEYAVADRMLGEWTTQGNPCTGPDAELTFHAQNTHVLPVAGGDDAFIVMFDRWNPHNLRDSRYVWLPAEFSDTGDLRIPWREQWSVEMLRKGSPMAETVKVGRIDSRQTHAEGEVPRKTSAIYVNPAGSDDRAGQCASGASSAGPVATLARALEIARSTGVRRIVLQAGQYMDVALQLGPQDTGLVIEAAEGEAVTLVGGHTLTGWTDEGDDCIACPVSGVREGTWDFRSLIVNGRFAERARYPETGTLEHASVFNSNWMSATAGGWDRKPTQEELTTLKYKGDDLGPWLSVRNAEVQIFHHWDDSLVGLSAHDPATKTLTFSSPAGHPAGAFAAWTAKARTYVIWNVREGMTKPGQWYLDRDRGCVVYRLRPGESGARIEAIAPTAQAIIEVKADGEAPARNIVIRNLEIMASTTPLKSAGFGASLMPGAIELRGRVEALAIEDCFIHHVGGIGIRGGAMEKVYPAHVAIRRCRIEDCGAGGINIGTNESCAEDCTVLRTGLVYISSLALAVQGRSNRIAHNEVAYCPYSAIVAGGTANRVENNRIHHFMETLDDGAAIYSFALKYGLYRGNVAIGSGSPTRLSHAYYLDEQSVGSVVEQNLAIDTGWPSHNHMLEFCAIRDNIFIDTHAAKITLMKSYRCFFEGNLVVAKAITVSSPEDGFLSFSNNVLAAADGVTLEQYGPDGYGISGHEPAQAENGNTFEDPRVTVSADSVVRMAAPAVLRGRCSNLKTDFRNAGPRCKPSAEDALPDRASVTKNKEV